MSPEETHIVLLWMKRRQNIDHIKQAKQAKQTPTVLLDSNLVHLFRVKVRSHPRLDERRCDLLSLAATACKQAFGETDFFSKCCGSRDCRCQCMHTYSRHTGDMVRQQRLVDRNHIRHAEPPLANNPCAPVKANYPAWSKQGVRELQTRCDLSGFVLGC